MLPADQLINLGVTGPALRAAGVDLDLRKTTPYSGYEHFDFQVPLGANGDAYDRYAVRVKEMRESVRIIGQALDGMPEGGHIADDRKVVLPPRAELATSMEALIHHFKLVTEGFRVPEGEAYAAVESPRGELGCYVVADGSPKPRRVHMRDPSFVNLQALRPMAQGRLPGRPDHDDRLARQRHGRRGPMTPTSTGRRESGRGEEAGDADEIPAHIDPMRPEFAEARSLILPALKFAQTEKGHLTPEDLAAVAEADRPLAGLRRERRLVLRPPLPAPRRHAGGLGVRDPLVHAARLGRAARAHLRARGAPARRRHQRGRRGHGAGGPVPGLLRPGAVRAGGRRGDPGAR